ncbi:hypothetical protein ACFLZW_03125, partial [Chloroflexota bacterium]
VIMMFKKIIVTILALSVLGATVAAFGYQVSSQGVREAAAADTQVLRQSGVDTGRVSEPNVAAQETLGDPWQATGTISDIDDTGLTMSLESGESVYVELGPPDYWQAQDIDIQVGQQATIVGTISDGMIHASEVQLPNAQVLELRTDQGQPLWSGGADNSQGQNRGEGDGEQTQDPQVQVEEWVTVDGTLMAFQGGNMTMSTSDGELVTFQSGQPRFFASQGVTFQVGDEISVVGFYNDAQFTAGEIIQVSSGMRVMLRDPNGRPLWAGPGNGNGNGNSSGNSNGNGGNH